MNKQANIYRQMSNQELQETLTQLFAQKRQLQSTRAQEGTLAKIIPDEKKLKYDTTDANNYKNTKKNIARIKTILRQRGYKGD